MLRIFRWDVEDAVPYRFYAAPPLGLNGGRCFVNYTSMITGRIMGLRLVVL